MLSPERPLYYGTSGPRDAKIVIIGESWGEHEAREQCPFVGPSGKELDRMLAEAGIHRSTVLCTNLIAEKPHGNETFRFFFQRIPAPSLRELEDLYRAALLNRSLSVSTCSLPTDLVIWLLRQGIGVSGGSAKPLEMKLFGKLMERGLPRTSKHTDLPGS